MVERKTIKDFENYSITENGDVYNKFGKLMKCQINDKGYCFVFLRMNKKPTDAQKICNEMYERLPDKNGKEHYKCKNS